MSEEARVLIVPPGDIPLGIYKAAIVMMALGQEEAGHIVRHLDQKSLQQITSVMPLISRLVPEELRSAMVDMIEGMGNTVSIAMNPSSFLSGLLSSAENAGSQDMLDRLRHGADSAGIQELRWIDPETVAMLLKDDHPQIIATVLAHLDRNQASEILKNLNERLRNDIVLRIATMDVIQPLAMRELSDVMRKLTNGGDLESKETSGGVKVAAELLNTMGNVFSGAIIEAIREQDTDTTQKIADEMFTFENLLSLDDRAIQTILREVPSDSLLTSLKAASEEMRDKIFNNMSQRAAETMREDLESRGPMRVSDVEREQKAILKIVRKLADEGQIQIMSGGADDFV